MAAIDANVLQVSALILLMSKDEELVDLGLPISPAKAIAQAVHLQQELLRNRRSVPKVSQKTRYAYEDQARSSILIQYSKTGMHAR